MKHRSVTMEQAVAWLASAGGGPVLAQDIAIRYGSLQGLTNALRHAERHGKVSRSPAGRKRSAWSLVPGVDRLADAVAKLETAESNLRGFRKLRASLEAM